MAGVDQVERLDQVGLKVLLSELPPFFDPSVCASSSAFRIVTLCLQTCLSSGLGARYSLPQIICHNG
jgi:hypothetical protein